jgi:hypothetical protein
MSKLSLHAVKRRAFPFAEACDPNVILGASFGEDMALTWVRGDIALSNACLRLGHGEK